MTGGTESRDSLMLCALPAIVKPPHLFALISYRTGRSRRDRHSRKKVYIIYLYRRGLFESERNDDDNARRASYDLPPHTHTQTYGRAAQPANFLSKTFGATRVRTRYEPKCVIEGFSVRVNGAPKDNITSGGVHARETTPCVLRARLCAS